VCSFFALKQGVQQPRPLSGIATAPTTFNRVYSPNRIYPQSNNSGRLSPSYGANGRTWVAVDKSKPKERGNDSLCDCIGTMDAFSDQNRGSRTRFRNQPTSPGDALQQVKEKNLISNGNTEAYNVTIDREQYNSPEFVTKYKDAKFFIIKSYSETENNIIVLNLSLNIKMQNSLSLNPTVKTIFIKASNLVSGPVLQMGTKNWMLRSEKLRKSLVDVPSFYSSRWVSLSIC
jgi:hypothetical protein